VLRSRRAVSLIIFCVLAIPLFSSCTETPAPTPPDPMAFLDYSSDANLAVTEIEGAHPVFLMNERPQNYDEVKAAYLSAVARPMKLADFLLETQKYLVVLGDGHMGSGLIRNSRYVDVKWVSIGSRLYMLGDDGKATDREVIQIGGVPIDGVKDQVDAYFFAENDSARQLQYGTYCRQEEMLMLAGSEFDDTIEIVTRDSSGETGLVECGFITADGRRIHYGTAPGYIIWHTMMDDVFYIDLRTFQKSNEVKDTAGAIKDAIKKGTRKFMIDIRGNGGGNSDVGLELLSAIGMTPPSYGTYICNSPLSKKQRGSAGNQPIFYREPDLSVAKRNGDISLVILTDRLTFSSATMLGVWVQDGGLGVIVGQPSSNAPTCYGDMLSLRLPTSTINLQISYKKFLRPDQNANQNTLEPDVPVEFGEDALDVALQYLKSR
jgi:hypothetical protein